MCFCLAILFDLFQLCPFGDSRHTDVLDGNCLALATVGHMSTLWVYSAALISLDQFSTLFLAPLCCRLISNQQVPPCKWNSVYTWNHIKLPKSGLLPSQFRSHSETTSPCSWCLPCLRLRELLCCGLSGLNVYLGTCWRDRIAALWILRSCGPEKQTSQTLGSFALFCCESIQDYSEGI